MFENILATILITFFAVIALVLSVAMIKLQRKTAILQRQLNYLTGELNVMSDGAIGVGRKLIAVEKNLKGLAQKSSYNNASVTIHDKAYRQAAKMFEKGVTVDEVMSCCEISRGEAELIANLHAGTQAESLSSGFSFSGLASS